MNCTFPLQMRDNICKAVIIFSTEREELKIRFSLSTCNGLFQSIMPYKDN